jgi:hypothetical protein
MQVTRRSVLKASVATASVAASPCIVRSAEAEFVYKYGVDLPATHPTSVWTQKAAERIKAETGGRLEIQVFPNSQLGSTTDMISQVRSGALEFCAQSGPALSLLVPATAINSIGFAFKSEAGGRQSPGVRVARPDREQGRTRRLPGHPQQRRILQGVAGQARRASLVDPGEIRRAPRVMVVPPAAPGGADLEHPEFPAPADAMRLTLSDPPTSGLGRSHAPQTRHTAGPRISPSDGQPTSTLDVPSAETSYVRQARRAASITATSIFFISFIATNARFA